MKRPGRGAIPVATTLLMSGCRITEDMGPGEKVALDSVAPLAAVALFALRPGVTFLAAARS